MLLSLSYRLQNSKLPGPAAAWLSVFVVSTLVLSILAVVSPARADTVEAEKEPATPSSTMVAATTALADGPDAGPWNQWRGPSRDGRVDGDFEWPSSLDCLEEQWRVELGKGYPGPIVTKDRVFVAATRDEPTEVVRALDRTTGRELWRVEWPGSWNVPFFARANGDWIRSTPAFDGETLYVGGIREVLVALDAETGAELWRIDFPGRYGTEVPHFGFASSPMVVGEHLYIQAANSLIKLEKATGKEVWRRLVNEGDIGASGAFSSPVLATLAGREQILSQDRHRLHGVDPQSGDTLWSREIPNFRGMNILTPTVYGDTIFTSTYQNGSFLFRVEPAAEGALELGEVWRHKASGYMSSPVVIDGHAYLHLGNGRLTAIDLESGEERWRTTPFGKYWSMAVQDDKILALDERGDLHLIRADPTSFDLLASRSIAEQPTWGHLAVGGSQIFVRELEAIAAHRWCQKPSDDSAGAAIGK